MIWNLRQKDGRGVQELRENTRNGLAAREVASPASPSRRRWGIVLAGGDGVRLRGLTRFLYGDDRPKQFCSLLGRHTLLQSARKRAERSVNPEQVLYSVTRAHHAYYVRDLADRPSQRIVQPCNKGTAPAILYALLRISRMNRDAIVAILPCDHYYSDENVFTGALESAFAVAEARPQSVVLLGAQPTAPEVEYGWIELGEAVNGPHSSVFHVRGFQEKPPFPIAENLFRIGSLWNTFVMVGHVNAFLEIALASVPDLIEILGLTHISSASDSEIRIADWLYDQLGPVDFSRQILSPGARRLVTVSLGEVEWNDLGDPERVISTLLNRDSELPTWVMPWLRKSECERAGVQLSASAAIA